MDETRAVVFEGVGLTRMPQSQRVEALREVDLRWLFGELTAVVGPSGGGKTSLLRLASRLEEPSAGRILLDGRDTADMDGPALRARVCLVSHPPSMFDGSVYDNLCAVFAFRRQPRPSRDDERLMKALEVSALSTELLDRPAKDLSFGQQQRLALARALVMRAPYYLLDEPTSGLDRPLAERVFANLRRLCDQGCGVVVVTHDLNLARRFAHKVFFVQEGRILEQGASNLLDRPATEALADFVGALSEPSS